MLLDVLGSIGGEKGTWVYDGGEGALGQVAGAAALRGGEVGLCGVVLVEF